MEAFTTSDFGVTKCAKFVTVNTDKTVLYNTVHLSTASRICCPICETKISLCLLTVDSEAERVNDKT